MSSEQKENDSNKIKAIICPSMLSSDFSNLSIEAERMVKNGADWLHMDVMDGHFVPNITIGPIVIKWLRNSHKDAFLDCHLMVSHPNKWIEAFAKAGANQISYHHETQTTMKDHENTINSILNLNMMPSIAINPKTEISDNINAYDIDNNPSALQVINAFQDKLSQVLIMTVEPGFGGQSFMEDMMQKVSFLRKRYPSLNIQVDGGLNVETIDIASKAGANVIVSGSGVFKYKEKNEFQPAKAIQIMRDSVNNAQISSQCIMFTKSIRHPLLSLHHYNARILQHTINRSFSKNVLEEMQLAIDRNETVPTAFTEYFSDGSVSVRGALNLTLFEEFDRDPLLFLMGEEVAQYNGAYKISKGLWEKYGDWRVIDTPITEMGFTGVGIGAALNSLHPIVEFMSFNFSMQAIDQIVNSAAKLRYMSGGTINVPITFRGCNGAAKAVGAQHSQDFSSWYSQCPGLKVTSVYDAQDARELLRASIRDPDPCVVLENEMLYGEKFKVNDDWFNSDAFPLAEFGKAKIMQSGSDLTIAAHGRMVQFALEAALELQEKYGVSVEVINNRCLRPMDRNTIIESVKKTNRIVYVEEGWPQCGIAAEICAVIMESDAFDYLDAPMQRVCGIDVPMPYCPNLEQMVLPSPADVVKAAKKTLNL